MPILVTATKGGAGATVVVASMGVDPPEDVVLVDAAGDLGAVIGDVPTDAVGLGDWLASDAPIDRLDELVVDVGPHAVLLPWSAGHTLTQSTGARWGDVMSWCRRREFAGATVVIDAGDHGGRLRHATSEPAGVPAEPRCRELVVTRACYLALRAERRRARTADAVVVVNEPGRGLSRRDVERSLGAPVVATIPWDPAVARSVDAGLSAGAIPRSMRRLGQTLRDAHELRATLREDAA